MKDTTRWRKDADRLRQNLLAVYRTGQLSAIAHATQALEVLLGRADRPAALIRKTKLEGGDGHSSKDAAQVVDSGSARTAVGDPRMSQASSNIFVAAIVVLSSASVFCGIAHAFDLNGAWATDPDQCSKVFEKRADGIALSDSSDLYGSGFVIDGKKVIGRTAKCMINSTKEDGSTVSFLASCATEIMFENIQFSLKIVDDNMIDRFFPGMPGMSITYSRCPSSALRRPT
jgi:hypothetical protein